MEEDKMGLVIGMGLVGLLVGVVVAMANGCRSSQQPAGTEPRQPDPAAAAVEALVVPYGAPRHPWPGGEVTSDHSPAALRRVVESFAQDGRPVPLVEEADGQVRGWIVALKRGSEGLMARYVPAPGADFSGRFFAPVLEEEVTREHAGTAVPRRLSRVLLTRKPSLPTNNEP